MTIDLTPAHRMDAELACAILALVDATRRMQFALSIVAFSHAGVWVVHASGESWDAPARSRLLLDLLWCRLRSGPTIHFGVGVVTAQNLQQIAGMLETGVLQPVVARRFSFEEMVEAHRCQHDERPSGDVIVEVVSCEAPTMRARSS